MNRRSFLRAAVVLAPAVILTPGLLMRVRPLDLAQSFVIPYVELPGERAFWQNHVALLRATNEILRDMAWIDHEMERGLLLAPRLLESPLHVHLPRPGGWRARLFK